MDKDIASILFMPVCTNCWKIIWQTVDARYEGVDITGSSPQLVGSICDIYPNKCPYCKVNFNHIAIPTKLAFNGIDYIT